MHVTSITIQFLKRAQRPPDWDHNNEESKTTNLVIDVDGTNDNVPREEPTSEASSAVPGHVANERVVFTGQQARHPRCHPRAACAGFLANDDVWCRRSGRDTAIGRSCD